jgi:integrase
MMGELRRRGKVWWIRYYRAGKRYEESSGSTKKGTAIDLLKVREGDGAKGLPVTPKIGRLRYEEAATDLLNDYKTRGRRSYDHLKRRLDLALTPWFAGRRMASITKADVTAYVAHRQTQGAANATINRELAALKRMFVLAVQGGKQLTRPHIAMLLEDNVRRGFFERPQFDSVRKHLPEPLQGVATFAYITGWRVQSEILPLEWQQIDRDAGTVRLFPGTTKNRAGRVFVYRHVTELDELIDALWKRHEALRREGTICPYVFQRFGGKRIRSFRKAWMAACKAAGCPGRVPHDFRRSAVRNFVRAGVPETVAMQMTGHKTRAVFMRYDIVSEGDLDAAAIKLNAAMNATGTKQGQSADELAETADTPKPLTVAKHAS